MLKNLSWCNYHIQEYHTTNFTSFEIDFIFWTVKRKRDDKEDGGAVKAGSDGKLKAKKAATAATAATAEDMGKTPTAAARKKGPPAGDAKKSDN